MSEYDAIVIGAGPAGCTAAKVAAERGLKVIILEQHKEVGVPQHCGGNFYSHGIKPKRFLEFVRAMDQRIQSHSDKTVKFFRQISRSLLSQSQHGSHAQVTAIPAKSSYPSAQSRQGPIEGTHGHPSLSF